MYFYVTLFLSSLIVTSAQLSQQSCPSGWVGFGRSCYKFTRSPRASYSKALEACITFSSQLVSVNYLDEHLFIAHFLRDNDPQHLQWWTSAREEGPNNWKWDGDRSSVSNIPDLWLRTDLPFPGMSSSSPYPTSSYGSTFGSSNYPTNYGSNNYGSIYGPYNYNQNQPYNQQANSQQTSNWSLGGKNAAYNFSQPENRWGLVPFQASMESAYICEVSKHEVDHVLVTERNIDYGVEVTDRKYVPRGPKLTKEPISGVFDLSGRSQVNSISLRCVAEGYPTPSYTWFKEEYDMSNRQISRLIDPLQDTRITLTDGTLTIHNPSQQSDRGKYHCRASNIYGTIVSETVQLTFGYIGDFNLKRSPDLARENWGKSIACDPPQHHPSVNYYWTRNEFPNFVEEDRRVFVSHDGNIYFSTIEKIDRANYSCNVQSVISSTGRTGPFFPLMIEPGSSGQKLLFPNNFPKSFPESPLAGQDVRLECVAYGYPVPSYNWTRVGVTDRLPDGSTVTSHGRVLIIHNVKVEDQGEYACTATSGRDLIVKAVTLTIQSLPVFTVPLTDRVMDRGASLVWTCEAFGIPDVSYKWYKNGIELDPIEINRATNGRYRIKDNVIMIDGLIPGSHSSPVSGDEGMYQCKASNALGSRFSSGQVKVLSLKPTFNKHKMDSEMYASVGTNFTIPCIPEAVPFPQFSWKKNGSPIGTSGRVRLLPNGFLYINPVDMVDGGEYTCIARNEHGVDQTTGYLTVFPRPKVVEAPKPKVVAVVNDTVTLECLAYVDGSLDVAYLWLHNGLRINFSSMAQFAPGYGSNYGSGYGYNSIYPYGKSGYGIGHGYSPGYNTYSSGGRDSGGRDTSGGQGYLRIINVTFAEAGEYTCLVKTSVGQAMARTELLVQGPPAAPGAVLAEDLSATSAKVIWSDGSDNGRRILAYNVEGRTNHNNTWTMISEYITVYSVDPITGRRSVFLNNLLSPWSTYEFRVSAMNELGTGIPSEPSPQYNTEKGVPFKVPMNVGGGGGKAGTLTITWDPLAPSDWNAPEVWYKIYFKSLQEYDYRGKELRSMGNIGMYTVSVGEENYFKPYQVQVQAVNPIGEGPRSPEVQVYSAESMPQVQPSLVKAFPFNSTALNVSWAQVDLSREQIRGRLIGHRIKYWRNGHDPETDSLTLLNRGMSNWGLIISLQPDTEYYVSVMAYNDAGSGPESEPFLSRTYKAAPQRPPTSVNVKAVDSTSVLVTWRGGSTVTADEEPILGYKVRYWEADQPLAKAKDVYKYLDGGDLEAVISGLVPGKVYKLRVLAYSWGGDGKMSSPAWEFKVGDGTSSKYVSHASSRLSFGPFRTSSTVTTLLLFVHCYLLNSS